MLTCCPSVFMLQLGTLSSQLFFFPASDENVSCFPHNLLNMSRLKVVFGHIFCFSIEKKSLLFLIDASQYLISFEYVFVLSILSQVCAVKENTDGS